MAELIFDGFLAAVLLFFLIFGLRIPAISSAGDFVEASGFPVIFSAIALILLAADMVRLVRKVASDRRAGQGQAESEFDLSKAYRVAIILAMTVLYIAAVKYAGFVLLSVGYTFAALNLLGSKKQGFNLIFAAASVLVLTLIFGRFFGIALPRGGGMLRTLSFYLY